LICAGVAAIGYLVLGLTESVWLSFGLVIVILAILFFFMAKKSEKIEEVTVE
jgi:type IV secretory pathway TrbD component